MVVETTKIVNPHYLLYPSLVEVDLEWWLAPSSERWSWCWICIPLSEEVDCDCLAKCLPLLCEVVILLVVYCLCERLYWLERGVVNSWLYCPKSSVEVPCVGVLCGQS